jgi:hypothetical protein
MELEPEKVEKDNRWYIHTGFNASCGKEVPEIVVGELRTA